VLSTDRARIMGEIRGQVNGEARQFGIEVVDVRIRRADLPEENTQAILSRMQSERERVAREARAEGAEVAQRVRAGAERERTVLIAEAQAQADVLRGQGEQEAIRIVAEAFSKDLDFFQFWRSMQAYREAFSEGGTRMVMTPESEFFRFFRDSGGRLQPLPTAPTATPAPAPAPANSSGSAPATPQ
jgi:membrane protease subunit HflC